MGNSPTTNWCDFSSADSEVPDPKVPKPQEIKKQVVVRSLNTPQHLKFSSAVKKIIYIGYTGIDWNVPKNTIRAAIDSGYNVILFAFYLNTGPFDFLLLWNQMSSQQQQELSQYAHDRGAILGLSAGGSTENPYHLNPVTYATEICNFAVANHLDLVDYDLEGIERGFTAAGTSNLYSWMQLLNHTSINLLGPDRYLTHTPQQPYLAQPGNSASWPSIEGGYYKVYTDCPDISWLAIQTYNQGTAYQTYEEVWLNCPQFPGSSFIQLNNENKGIPMEKLVYGSYLLPSDGSGGIFNPQDIHNAFVRAKSLSWTAGSMLWLWNTQGSPSPREWLDVVFAEPLYYTSPNTQNKRKSERKHKRLVKK